MAGPGVHRIAIWLEQCWHDLRHGTRTLRAAPGLTMVTVVTMGVGIGLTTAVFSLLYAVLLRPLPYREPERLVAVWQRHATDRHVAKVFDTWRDFEEWKQRSRSFSELAVMTWARGPRTLTGHGVARSVIAFPASVEFFSLLGAAAAQGRTFDATDLDRGCTVVLAHRFWQNVLGAESQMVGRSLTLDHEACTVVGVMPAEFAFYPEATELWTLITPHSDLARQPDQAAVGVFGRLRPGVTPESAQTELTQLHRQLHARVDTERQSFSPIVNPLRDELTWLAGRNLRTSLVLLFGAAIAVLLVACVNVASMLVGRGVAREHEFAVRAALGSSGARLRRQLLTESLLIAMLGAGAGVLLANGAIRIVAALRPMELPPATRLAIDVPLLLFATLTAVCAALLCGLWPAWSASRTDLQIALQAASERTVSRGHRMLSLLVIAEVSLSVLVLIGAGLLIQSAWRFANAPLGFTPDRVITQLITLPADTYATPAQRLRFYAPLLERLASQPGIESMAISSSLPLSIGSSPLTIEGRPATAAADSVRYDVGEQSITPGYTRLLGVPLLRGRLFDAGDRDTSAPVAIVNDALVREYFPDEDPLGKRIRVGRLDDDRLPWLTIVGVVGTELRGSVYQEMAWVSGAFVFRPIGQSAPQTVILLARGDGNGDVSMAATRAIQREIATLDPAVPIAKTTTLASELQRRLAFPRTRAVLIGLFGVIALFLAAVGMYGVLSHSVAQRRREMGIRLALGADRGTVLRLVTWQGLRLALAGAAVGLMAAWTLTRTLATFLYGVAPTDPSTLAGAALVVIGVSCVATWLPARRAAGVDPLVTLRRE